MMTSGNPKKIMRLAEAQNWRFAYCPTVMQHRLTDPHPESDRTATIDHVIAKGSGGHAVWDNEIAACAACNVAKAHYSARLFFMLMVEHCFNRQHVKRTLARMTRKERKRMRCRLARSTRSDASIDSDQHAITTG